MTKPRSYLLSLFLGLALAVGAAGFLWPGVLIEAGKLVYRWYGGLTHKHLQAGAFRWSYLTGGAGDTFLFIHGFGADKYLFRNLLLQFVRSHQVVVPDLPGFGESTKLLSASYDIPSQVARLHRFVQALGLERFHLLGISMGGYIAAYYASEHPEKVKSLILFSAAGVSPAEPSWAMRQYRQTGRIVLLYRNRQELDQMLQAVFYKVPWIPGFVKRHAVSQGVRNYALRRKILSDIEQGGLYLLDARLPLIQAPTLVIWGANDRIVDVSSVAQFRQGLEKGRVVVLEQCGHVPYLEKPRLSYDILTGFLNGRLQLPVGVQKAAPFSP